MAKFTASVVLVLLVVAKFFFFESENIIKLHPHARYGRNKIQMVPHIDGTL